MANVTKNVNEFLLGKSSVAIIDSIIAVDVAIAKEMTADQKEVSADSEITMIAQKEIVKTEILNSEAVITEARVVAMIALASHRIVLLHVEVLAAHEAIAVAVHQANRPENATRSTKLSCILGE